MKTKKVDCTFRFKTIETDEECEQLRKALGILDITYTVKRMKDIDAKITALRARGTPSQRSLPYDFYDYALQAYAFGLDIASIMYCFSAIELMLRLLLRGDKNKNDQTGFRLNELIENAHKKGVLDEKHAELANNLRMMRNYYIHYINHVDSYNELYQNAVKLVEAHRDLAEKEELRKTLSTFHERFTRTKFFGISAGKIKNEKLRKFLDDNEKRYQRWLKANHCDFLELTDLRKSRHFSIDRFNALSAMEWASRILTKSGQTSPFP